MIIRPYLFFIVFPDHDQQAYPYHSTLSLPSGKHQDLPGRDYHQVILMKEKGRNINIQATGETGEIKLLAIPSELDGDKMGLQVQ